MQRICHREQSLVMRPTRLQASPNEEYSSFEFPFFFFFIALARHNSTVQYHVEIEDKVNRWIFYNLYLECIPVTIQVAIRITINM